MITRDCTTVDDALLFADECFRDAERRLCTDLIVRDADPDEIDALVDEARAAWAVQREEYRQRHLLLFDRVWQLLTSAIVVSQDPRERWQW